MKVREQEPEGFEKLWLLWRDFARKTDGRGKARPTYRRWLLDGADPADIYDGAAYHLRTMPEKDRPYINLLSVYINSERWIDECEKERSYQARLAEIEAKRTQPAPKPLPEPVQAEQRASPERAREIMAQYGYAKPGELH